MSDMKQVKDFINDYNQTAVLSIIYIYATHYYEQQVIKDLWAQYQGHEQFECPKVFKRKFKRQCNAIDKKAKRKNLLGDSMQRFAYSYAKDYLHQHEFQDLTAYGQKTKKVQYVKLTPEILNEVTVYHDKIVKHGIPQFGLSTYEMFKIVKLNHQLKQLLP